MPVSAPNEMDQDLARRWVARWDRQQEGYIPDRETIFAVIGDTIEAALDRAGHAGAPVVVDLGCGPGSLSARLLDRFRAADRDGARVVGVDTDPLLLHLARSVYGTSGLTVVDHDLRDPDWTTSLGLDGPADAVVSTTALHWLRPDELGRIYAQAAGLLRPGGVLINGDGMPAAATGLAALQHAVEQRQSDRLGVRGREEWGEWWTAITAAPELADLVAERAGRATWHPEHEPIGLDEHVRLLHAAGFAEVGPVWQYGGRHVLVAIKA